MELGFVRGIAPVGPGHVVVDQRQRHVQVEIERQYDARDKHHERCEGGVLEVGEPNLHRPEFDAPAHPRPAVLALGRRLPSDGLPVGTLDGVEMVALLHRLNLMPALQREGVASEEVRHVLGQRLVDAGIAQQGQRLGVHRSLDVVEALLAALAVSKVTRDGVVPRFWQPHGAAARQLRRLLRAKPVGWTGGGFASLGRRPVVD
mmetsp:Transcript_37790/g.121515  ORF Transcript_37790/g.121515 Transcript_37790/m.121515 type:complete len:204 (+) Transcript_37790:756-1367(+)